MQFDLVSIWSSMGPIAKTVAFVLIGFSIYSVAVGIERFMVYSKAKKQSQDPVEADFLPLAGR